MIRTVVIDTSVLVSAALNEASIPAQAFRRALELFSPVRSEETLAELQEVLRRPKLDRFVSLARRQQFLQGYEQHSIEVPITQTVVACRDPRDDKFLSLALSSHALLIVSSDLDLTTMNPFQGVQILTAREFLDAHSSP